MDQSQNAALLQALQGMQTGSLDNQSPSLGLPGGGAQGLPTAQYSYGSPMPTPEAYAAGVPQGMPPGMPPDMYSALMSQPPAMPSAQAY